MPEPQQCGIRAASATHTTAQCNARSSTHLNRCEVVSYGDFSYFFLFFGHSCSMWKFLSQGLNLNHSSDNANSLTCYVTRELLHYSFYLHFPNNVEYPVLIGHLYIFFGEMSTQILCCFVLFCFFCFLVPHLRHMEVPKLGVQSELHL